MADYGHEETDRQLAALEKRISRIYREASDDIQKKIEAYFKGLVERDKHQRKLLEAGQITEDQYKQWRLNQIARGARFEALRDAVAERYTNANEVAVAYVNDATPGIYSLNRNYAAYTIEQIGGNVGFTLWDEQTVRRLIMSRPDLMPYYPEKRALKRGIDLAWGKEQITKQVTAGILQGESIGAIADRLQKNIPEMNRNSAIRAARTAVTGAQNAGRMDSYAAAEKMGISVRKRWVATKDGRTRHEHGMADGQTVPQNKPFEVGGYKMMYPGDPSAPGHLLYNCRCTMRTVEKEGIEAEPRQMRVRDPKTGRNVLVNEMTYKEWEKWKLREKSVETPQKPVTIKKTETSSGGAGVEKVASIDKRKYAGVSKRIRAETVVLTDNQRQHIINRRGQEFFEKYSPYFREIAEDPDYIFIDKAHENTALATKTLEIDGANIHLVIRLAIESDDEGLENSIITAIAEGDKRYRQRIRNNFPVYKKS